MLCQIDLDFHRPRSFKSTPLSKEGICSLRKQASETRNFDRLYLRHPRRWIAALLVVYIGLAANYARLTPPWQVPDEPAHYNYIAHIATQYRLPVLRMRDYDQPLLEQMLRLRFPPGAPLERIRYESYQPPLYYLIATPVFWLSGGNLLALRLFNILLGAVSLLLLYRCLELVFPGKPLISVSAAAFAGLLPMHVAMTASVNNDGLAELLVLVSLFLLLTWMRDQFCANKGEARAVTQGGQKRHLVWLGVALGLGLLTKIYAYALLPVCALFIVALLWRRTGRGFWGSVSVALWTVIPAVLLGLPLWVRNWLLYGPGDILGTAWHDQVVADQPATAAWIAENGFGLFFERALSFTFRSFWGVFGWLGVFMDERIYTALLLFTGVLFLGLLWAVVRLISAGPDMDMDDFQLWVLALFATLVVTVSASYVWYNLKFVQHQGRYFFWGLLPISAFVGLAWREVLRPLQGLITGILFLVLTFSFLIVGYANGDWQKWTLLTSTLFAFFLIGQSLLLLGIPNPTKRPSRIDQVVSGTPWLAHAFATLRTLAWATPFLLLALLNFLIPTLYILPQLAE